MATNPALDMALRQYAKASASGKKAMEPYLKSLGWTGGGTTGGGAGSGTGSPGGSVLPTPVTPTVTPATDTRFPAQPASGDAVPARPTDLKKATDETLFNAQNEAMRLATEEEKRGYAAEDLTKSAVSEANKPTLSDQDISLAFGQDVDANAPDFLGKMSSLRDYMGGAGITGGGAMQGLATQFELGRLGQNTDAKRSLFLEKAKSDSLDRVRNFQNQMALATQMQRPVAMQWSDFLGQNAGIDLAREGFQSAETQAKYAADATKKAAKTSSTGGILGGVLGAIGSLF